MLNGLKKIIDGLATMDAADELTKIVEDNKERITELQQEQLAAGIDVTGKKRVDEYRPLTKELKRKYGSGLGAVTDRVTFFMTGELYGSLKTEVKGQAYQVTSPLSKYGKMKERIGDENYGLDPDQREEFATEITIPEFSKVLETKTGIKII